MSESLTARVFTERAQNERRHPTHLFVGDSQCLLSDETVVIKGGGLHSQTGRSLGQRAGRTSVSVRE